MLSETFVLCREVRYNRKVAVINWEISVAAFNEISDEGPYISLLKLV